MYKYIYKGEEINSIWQLRQKVWEQDHIVFGSIDEALESLGIEKIEVADPEVSIEAKAERIRQQRDRALEATDYLFMPDREPQLADYATEEEYGTAVAAYKVELEPWRIYRQQLRDVPQQEGFPEIVTWPQKPRIK